jgi:glutathione S-transferase
MTADITLYFCKYSRAFIPRWLLEELAISYRVEMVRIDRHEQKSPDYLRLNPMGKVPTLTDGETVVSENPAICLLLADRYGYGTLAPRIDDAARGAYLKWMVFATAVFEPAVYLDEPQDDVSASGRGWGKRADALGAMADAVSAGPWLLGDRFSAADVMLGGLLSIALFNKRIADPPPQLATYDARLAERPAYRRATEATFG